MTNMIKSGGTPEFRGFILEWHDLPEDLRERKITTLVTHKEMQGAYEELNNSKDVVESERQFIKRRDGEKELSALFPIYL